jgi:hypothetical protein
MATRAIHASHRCRIVGTRTLNHVASLARLMTFVPCSIPISLVTSRKTS